MVEQTHARKRHYHTVLVAGVDNNVVTNGAAGLCYVGNTALLCPLDIITEGEEGVGAERNSLYGVKICSCLTVCKRLGTGGKVFLPISLRANVLLILINISVYNVISVGTGYIGKKRKVKNLLVLTEMPGISLCSRKTGTVNS